MSESHDPLCLRWQERDGTYECRCDVLAEARADERERRERIERQALSCDRLLRAVMEAMGCPIDHDPASWASALIDRTRADERERIAQAIEAESAKHASPMSMVAMAAAARIARGTV